MTTASHSEISGASWRSGRLGLLLISLGLATGACADSGPEPEEQRDVVIRTAETLVGLTSESMKTGAVEVTDDGAAPRTCPEGGSQYVYAAVIGPADWKVYAETPAQALNSTHTAVVGWLFALGSEPEYDFAPVFDDQTSSLPTEVREPRSARFATTNGEHEGIAVTTLTRLTDAEDVYVDLSVQTRCG